MLLPAQACKQQTVMETSRAVRTHAHTPAHMHTAKCAHRTQPCLTIRLAALKDPEASNGCVVPQRGGRKAQQGRQCGPDAGCCLVGWPPTALVWGAAGA